MHQASTIEDPKRSTSSPVSVKIDCAGKTCPQQSLWRVDVQIIGTAYTHHWTGYACDTQQARERGHKDAGQAWPGFGRCVRTVCQVGA